ncbi:MAG TPA: ABC transporter permease [Gemmatimonadaceae bacterium]|nr:ABC transporter permease [Gemmatimonadaceae bacterium]
MLNRLRYAAAALLGRARVDRDLDDEIAFHIDRETERNVERGLTPDEARRQALVMFGGAERLKEAHRDARGTRWLEDVVSDARYALRGLKRNWALTIAAIGTLALVIGANTAIFSAVDAVLLRPLPFADPDRLVMIGENNREFLWHMADAAPANYLDWRARVPGFSDAMAYADFPLSVTLMVDGAPQLAPAAIVTGNFFSVLGINAEIGRTLRDEETWRGGANVVVISDRLWRRTLGGKASIVGSTISIGGAPATVVGVAPPSFRFPRADVDIWTPISWPKEQVSAISFRRAHWLRVVARLKPGVSAADASVQLRDVAQQLKVEYPVTNRIMEAELAPLHRFLVGDTRLPLLIVLGAVGLLLLIACANVGNLQLVRAASRQREVAVRVALGAGRLRLMRQAFTESLLLAAIGGALGIVLGWLGTRLLVALQPADGSMVPVAGFTVDWRVAAFVLGISAVCGLLFGLAPAAWSSGRSPNEALAAGGRAGSQSSRVRGWSEKLAVVEVAIALALTVGAGLLVRSYSRLLNVDPGFDSRNVLATSIELPPTRYNTAASTSQFFEQLVARVRAIPGVVNVAAVTQLPLTMPGWSSDFSIEGASAGNFSVSLVHRQVTPDYFQTMRVPLLRGRWFTTADRGAPYVIVINDEFARTYFKGQDPVGQRITFDKTPDSSSTWRTIVGVVGSEHQISPATPPANEAIAPFTQEQSRSMSIIARTSGDPVAIAPAVRRSVSELDPQLAIASIRTMADVRAASMSRDRFLMTLLSLFGVLGFVLAIVGVYGVVAQLARSRTREMGIRIALGARGSAVQWLVVRHGLVITTLGVVIGGAGALLGARVLARVLYGIAPTDAPTFLLVIAALIGAALAASWLPALRSGRVDPVMILRDE